MKQALFCPYCDSGPKDVADTCCGESSAHFVMRPVIDLPAPAGELFLSLKRLIRATTQPATWLHREIVKAEELIKKIEGQHDGSKESRNR